MATISYGDNNHIVSSLNVNSDTVTFGNGQQDKLSLTGDENTVTFGKGNQDSASVNGLGDNVTFGDGNQDSVTGTLPFESNNQNVVILGNGNQDSANISGTFSAVILGNGNQDSVSLAGDNNVTLLGDGNGDKLTLSGDYSNGGLGNGNNNTITVLSGERLIVHAGNGRGNTVNYDATNGQDDISFSQFSPDGLIYTGHDDTINISGSAMVIGGSGHAINISGIGGAVGSTGDTFNLFGGKLWLGVPDAMVFIRSGSNSINDFAQGMQLNIGPTTGLDILGSFGADLTRGVIDLIGGIGGFKTTAAVLSALTSDSSGGTLLSFGPGSSLDIQGVLPSALEAHNFKIG